MALWFSAARRRPHLRSTSDARNESQAEGLPGETRSEKLHAHEREQARLQYVRLHAGRPAHAHPGRGALLFGVLPALRIADAVERNMREGIGAGNQMTPKTLRFSQLSAARQAFVRLCQAINHGSIEDLEVRDSEPVLDPMPVTLKDVKLDSDDGLRPELALDDFVVGDEVSRLMRLLDDTKNGTFRRVEIRGGLARRLVLESRPSRTLKA